MAPQPLPDEHHIARHVRGTLVQRVNGKVVGCFPDAFKLRDATDIRPAETYLSACWLEWHQQDCEPGISSVAQEISSSRTLKARDALAIVSVKKLKEVGSSRGQRLRVLHEPSVASPSYTAVRGMNREDQELLQLIAAEAVAETVNLEPIVTASSGLTNKNK